MWTTHDVLSLVHIRLQQRGFFITLFLNLRISFPRIIFWSSVCPGILNFLMYVYKLISNSTHNMLPPPGTLSILPVDQDLSSTAQAPRLPAATLPAMITDWKPSFISCLLRHVSCSNRKVTKTSKNDLETLLLLFQLCHQSSETS